MNYKYFLLQVSNGVLTIASEWDDINKAIVAFHQKCASFWNDKAVTEGIVQLVYSADLSVVNGYSERISHPQTEEE